MQTALAKRRSEDTSCEVRTLLLHGNLQKKRQINKSLVCNQVQHRPIC